MLNHPQLRDMDIKESAGDASCFPRMRIVVKDEIVHLGTEKPPLLIPAFIKHRPNAQAAFEQTERFSHP